MKAILLAAGFGTRLRPLTFNIPKCLVPINGKPLLQIWLERLTESSFENFLINTHYLSNQVNDFVNSSEFKEKCILKNEVNLLGTAGTVLANLDFIGEDECMLVHADNYCLANFCDFIGAHNKRPSSCLMTMMTFRTDIPSSCGIVELDENNVVIGFHEKVKSPPGNLANGAIYIISKEMISFLKKYFLDASDFSTEILPNFLGRIYSYETSDIFLDIGSPEALRKANSYKII